MNQLKSLMVKGQYGAIALGALLLAFPAPLKAQETNPCRSLGRGDTAVVVKADSQARIAMINQVVQERNLQGEFCQTGRGKTVWMSSQLESVETAVQVYRYFKDAGLVKPTRARQPV